MGKGNRTDSEDEANYKGIRKRREEGDELRESEYHVFRVDRFDREGRGL